ncbi:MAG: M23 family metallopeptidase [Oscillospiraceae bacterium]|nr:M23 family metallopeptidase [Oscillospiraceae bacterium]
MADRRDYSGRRGGMPYRPVPYGQRESAPKAAGGMLPLQIFICAVFLLCLLGGWLLDAQWFADGKQLLLAQINAADQTQQVETILSGIFKKQESNGQVPATTSDAATLTPEEEKTQQAGASPEKLEELYRYIERYSREKDEKQTDAAAPAGMGGYLPISLSGAGQESGTARYLAPEGCLLSPVAVSAKPLLPLKRGTVTSAFGYRIHPITGELDFHTGLDLAAAQGTRVSTAWPGIVSEVGWSDIYGNYALVSHSGGLATFYAHCDSIAAKQGAVLRQGELIGYVGSTGWSTGPHLHWEIRINGLRVDPSWILVSRQPEQQEDGFATA